jgi:hypothetical protein
LPLFHFAGASGVASTLGDEDLPLITAISTVGNQTTNGNASAVGYPQGSVNTTALSGGLNLQEDQRFIVTSLDTDLSDIETMYYEVTNIDYNVANPTDVTVELRDLIGSEDITLDSLTDYSEKGDIKVNMTQVNSTNVYLKFFTTDGTKSFNTAVSDTGLEVVLPANSSGQTSDLATGVPLTFIEANKDGDLGKGMQFTAFVKSTTNNKLHVLSTNVSTLEDASDVYVGYVPSDLTSKVTLDETNDEYDFDIEYYGVEVPGKVMVVGGESTTSSGGNVLGDILVKDTEVSSVATKNLIVVGGSCINSAAAALVGGAKCGAAWTTETGVGTGQFLIKGYATSSITSKLALLVAGYDAADTVKATTYLTNKNVDTSKAYKGTTSTELAVVIE